MQNEDIEKKLARERDFLSYLRLLKRILSKYIIMVAVADTGVADYFTSDCAEALMDLGLKFNMQERYRQPYIAIINKGNIIEEKCSEDLGVAIISRGRINGHSILIYSGGFMCSQEIGSAAGIFFDGIDYSVGRRGFNFLIYDIEKDCVIDSSHFDTFENQSFKPYAYIDSLKSIKERILSAGAALCLFRMPKFPSPFQDGITEQEKSVRDFGTFDTIRDNVDVLKKVWENKSFHYCNDFDSPQDLLDALSTPESFVNMMGVRQFKDKTTHVVNTRNGIRVTTDQPLNPKRSIFLVGLCTTFGVGADDAHTIASYLQRILNKNVKNKHFIVHNYGFFVGDIYTGIIDLIPILESLPVKKGDIVFLQFDGDILDLPYCDLRLKSIRPHKYGEMFLDKGHFSKNGNHMTADGIYEFLSKNNFFDKPENDIKINASNLENKDITPSEHKELIQYKQKLRTFYNQTIRPKIGSIVMNCNPFTNGHRYLVEQALKRCDHLIVFVVEEDKSVFPFTDRIKLVRKNLADLKHVSVIPSGQFVISTRTFQEYFNKESMQEQKIDASLDVIMFAEEIAPCLNISMRFAGEEPLDNVTRQYNENMARLLPRYGIKFLEIPRMRFEGVPISATEVRYLAKAREFERLKKLVPAPTLHYLRRKFAKK